MGNEWKEKRDERIKGILKNNLEFGKGKDDFNYWYLNSLFYLAYKNTKLRIDKPFSIKIGEYTICRESYYHRDGKFKSSVKNHFTFHVEGKNKEISVEKNINHSPNRDWRKENVRPRTKESLMFIKDEFLHKSNDELEKLYLDAKFSQKEIAISPNHDGPLWNSIQHNINNICWELMRRNGLIELNL